MHKGKLIKYFIINLWNLKKCAKITAKAVSRNLNLMKKFDSRRNTDFSEAHREIADAMKNR